MPADTQMTEIDDDIFLAGLNVEFSYFESDSFQGDDAPIRDGVLSLSGLEKWLDSAENHTSPNVTDIAMRVLNIPMADPFRMAVPKDTWKSISASLSLHPSTAEAFLDNNGAFAAYVYKSAEDARRLERFSLLMKFPNKVTIGYHALSVTFDGATGRVTAVVHGARGADWRALVDVLRASAPPLRASAPPLRAHPLLLPALLFSLHHRRTTRFWAEVDYSIWRTELETGYGKSGRLERFPSEGSAAVPRRPPPAAAGASTPLAARALDFEGLVRRLHSYQTELATLAHVARFGVELGDFLARTVDRLAALAPVGGDDESLVAQGDEVVRLLELPRSQTFTMLNQIQSLKDRVQSQTNLVFSLISQDENRISRLVAEESAKIASASKRDSAAMKVVALLTMLFLPATFVAAFFSMPLFDWNTDVGSAPVASPFMWVYWVVTLPLTVAMMVGWRLWWKTEEASSRAEDEKAKMDNRDRLAAR